ncbi:unnamed protein product [Fusarium venenatum]|uniref:Uncharacterized protein n=1 Tax=Fusarium venenatum TaxID=56646 RepID=A0A2L2TF22_9HYPO|nr:uncharacterized protein FVRRES_09661 [Fusarium venenatum]CEI69584.1 unnamed protein product [Fusarium venenatum]
MPVRAPRTPGSLPPAQGPKRTELDWADLWARHVQRSAEQGSQHPRPNTCVEADAGLEDRYIEHLWCQIVRHIPRAHQVGLPPFVGIHGADTDMPLI